MTRLVHLLSLALGCCAHGTPQASHCPATEGGRPLVPASLLQLPGGRGAAKAWAFEDAQDRHSDAQATAAELAAGKVQPVQQATREETPSQPQLVGGASLMQHTVKRTNEVKASVQHQAQQEQGQKTQQSQQQLQQQQLLMKTAVRTAAEQRMLQRAVSASSMQPRVGAESAAELYIADDDWDGGTASASMLELGASLAVKASGDLMLTVLVLGILSCVAIYFFFGRPNKTDDEEDCMTTKYAPFNDQGIDTGLSPQSGSPGLGEVPRQDPFATGPDHVAPQGFQGQQDVTLGPSSNWPSTPTMPVISPQNAAHHVKEPVCC